jgi:MFS family permease
MQMWSLLWHLRELSDQPIVLSGLGAVRFVPILVFALVGGVVADTFNRRRILFFTVSTYSLVALSLFLLTATGAIQIWHIYVLTAIQATASSFDLPARQSLVPNLVPRDVLPNAYSLQSIAGSTGAIIGPALSGLVIAQFGQQATYLINALTYSSLFTAIILIGDIPQSLENRVRNLRDAIGSAKEGVRFILTRPIILSSMLLDFFATFFSSANTLLPFVARDILHVSVREYGWLSAAQSIGSVTIAGAMSQRANIKRQGAVLLWAVGVFGLATVLFGISRTFWITLAALILIGASDTVSMVLRNTIRQLQTPDHLRGRMVSINQIFFMGGPQLGEIEAGLVAQVWDIPTSIVVGGIGCLVSVAIVTIGWPALRRYRGDEHLNTSPA